MSLRAMKKALQTIIISALCLAFQNGRAETVMDFVKPGCTVRHAVFPFYSEPDRKLSAVVRVEKARMDYQRKGFFHIGVLPVCAMEGVTIEILDTRTAAGAFQQMQRWLGAGDENRVELRRVKFLFSTNSLEAGTAHCRAGNRWELLDGVRLVAGGNETRAERATFQVAGREAGQVVLEAAPEAARIFPSLIAEPEH